MATVDPRITKRLARLPTVRAKVRAVAEEVLAAAKTRAEAHRHDGDLAASLKVVRGATDAQVVSTDPRALSKEYGHTDPDTGRVIPGLHVLGGAAADAAARR